MRQNGVEWKIAKSQTAFLRLFNRLALVWPVVAERCPLTYHQQVSKQFRKPATIEQEYMTFSFKMQ